VKYTKLPSQLRAKFSVSGKIMNTTEESRPVPSLRVTLTDDEGVRLQYWDFDPGKTVLEAGKSIPFNTDALESKFVKGTQLTIELGNGLELALR